MIRLFIGLGIPDAVAERLSRLPGGVPDARWMARDTLHLTLRFVGEVDEGVAADLDAALAGITVPAPEVRLRGLGRFGDRRGARALWIGVEPAAALLRLRDKVETACVAVGLPPEGRRYKPHVTLARFPGARPGGPRADALVAAHGDWDGGGFVPDAFTLFRSFLGRDGAHYEALCDYPLV
jgi:2'-5' RNA ligase